MFLSLSAYRRFFGLGLAQGFIVYNVHRLVGGGHRVMAGKAAGAEPALAVDGQLGHMFNAQVAQGIGPHDLADLLHRMAGGNQVFFVRDVGAEIAGVGKRRGRNAVVYFLGTGVAQQLMVRALVVPRTMESSTSTTRLPATVEKIAFNLMRTLLSRWAWEPWMKVRPTYLFFNKAHAIGNTAFLRIAKGGIQAGIRRTDDDIGFHRMLLCQKASGLQAGVMHAGAPR